MLFLLGPTRTESVVPSRMTAELYRANDIENFDFGAFRIFTDNDVEVLFLGAHPLQYQIGPIFHAAFEEADVSYAPYGNKGSWRARSKDGRVTNYGDGGSDKLGDCIEAARTGGDVSCGVRGAAAHVIAICGARESMPEIKAIPEDMKTVIDTADSKLVTVDHLEEVMVQCYESGLLPSELGDVPWAVGGKEVDLIESGRMFRETQL